jgi:hypothetical protein
LSIEVEPPGAGEDGGPWRQCPHELGGGQADLELDGGAEAGEDRQGVRAVEDEVRLPVVLDDDRPVPLDDDMP